MYNTLKKLFHDLNIDVSEEQINKFVCFYDLLIEKNKVMNLTAITDCEDVAKKHFIDSILPILFFDFSNVNTVADVGTGAGFPGIPLAILFPKIRFTLMDSLNKRLNFINEVCSSLNLNNITCVHGRAEDLAHINEYRNNFDLVLSRAVAPLPVLIELCIPFVNVNGKFISYKSSSVDDEIESSINAQNKLKCSLADTEIVQIPDTDISRKFLVFNKSCNTPKLYPRKAGTPKKEPL